MPLAREAVAVRAAIERGGRYCGMEANGLAVQLTRTSASESEGWRISHHIEPALQLRSPSPKCGALRQALLAHSGMSEDRENLE